MTAKKVSKKRTSPETIVERLGDTVVGQPIAIANKAFLASLGLVSQFQSDFDAKYEELVKDGEAVRDRYEASLTDIRKKLTKRVNSARDEVANRFEPVVDRIVEMTPVARASDIDELNKKLDKVLAQVAK